MQFEQSEIALLRRQMEMMNSPTLRTMRTLIARNSKAGLGDPDRVPVTLDLMRQVLVSRVIGPKGKLP